MSDEAMVAAVPKLLSYIDDDLTPAVSLNEFADVTGIILSRLSYTLEGLCVCVCPTPLIHLPFSIDCAGLLGEVDENELDEIMQAASE